MSKRRTVKLNELAAPGRSVISGPFGSNIGQRFFQDVGVPVIRGNNLTTDFRKFNDEGFVFLTEKKADELKSDAIREDILFTAAGTIGQVGMIPKSSKYERYVISNKQLRFRVNPEIADPEYVYYWLASPWIYKNIINRNTGSTVPLINLGIIKSLPVSLPETISEQRKISRLFSLIDERIILNNRINAELEAMAKTLYDCWFVQFDFPDINGKPYKTSGGKMVYNPTLKREIPMGWDSCKLGEFIKIEYGKPLKSESRTGSGYPVYGSSGIVGFHNDYLVEGPGIIIGRKGTVGKVNFAFENFYPIDTAYYVSPKKRISVIFLNYLISSLGLEGMNSDSAVPGLNREVALGLSIVSAPLELISKYHAYAVVWFDKKKIIVEENNTLIKLRDWLLPMLMNGQVTVR